MRQAQRERINERLEKLARDNGGNLTAEMVIADAKDKTSPLHLAFDWNDVTAAHAHRVTTANRLINGWKAVVEIKQVEFTAPAVIREPGQRKVFSPIEVMAARRDDAEAVFRAEVARILAAIDRARGVAAGLNLVDAIPHLEKATADVRRAVAEAGKVVA